MQSQLINSRERLSEESRKAFQEFQKNQKECTLKAHKILIAFFALVNIILFLFIILYKYQVSSLQNSIEETHKEIVVQEVQNIENPIDSTSKEENSSVSVTTKSGDNSI